MTVFPYLIDRMTSTLAWRTYVGQTFQDEWRQTLMPFPSLKMEVSLSLLRDQNADLIAFVQEHIDAFKMPDWRVAMAGVYSSGVAWPAAYRYVSVGDKVAVFLGNEVFETEVDSMTSTTVVFTDSFDGMMIYFAPILEMKVISDISFSQRTGIYSNAGFTLFLDEYVGFGNASLPQFLEYPVMNRPLLVRQSGQALLLNRDGSVSDAGVISLTRDRIRDQIQGAYGFRVSNSMEMIDEEKKIMMMEGRSRPFWISTWQQDFVLKNSVGASDEQITARPRLTKAVDRVSAIMIRNSEGVSYHEVDIVTSGPNEVVINLQFPTGRNIDRLDPSLVISRLDLMRFDSDEIKCEIQNSEYSCSAATVEVFR